jgi:hypothetical protein
MADSASDTERCDVIGGLSLVNGVDADVVGIVTVRAGDVGCE